MPQASRTQLGRPKGDQRTAYCRQPQKQTLFDPPSRKPQTTRKKTAFASTICLQPVGIERRPSERRRGGLAAAEGLRSKASTACEARRRAAGLRAVHSEGGPCGCDCSGRRKFCIWDRAFDIAPWVSAASLKLPCGNALFDRRAEMCRAADTSVIRWEGILYYVKRPSGAFQSFLVLFEGVGPLTVIQALSKMVP